MIAIRGFASPLSQALLSLLPEWETAVPVERGGCNSGAERHLFAQGLLRPQAVSQQSSDEIAESLMANAIRTIQQCDLIFAVNPKARVCVIGSESGFAWSFDGAYAAAKAAVHRYVETKRLPKPEQQLICVAPSIIADGGMTLRRDDAQRLAEKAAAHPKGRFLTCAEVARLIHHVLYVDEGYLSGVVIRLNGGQHT
jgi:NAD(P)-dependent dehydrogenase (short-subunit alcohol dehydrogenase family)